MRKYIEIDFKALDESLDTNGPGDMWELEDQQRMIKSFCNYMNVSFDIYGDYLVNLLDKNKLHESMDFVAALYDKCISENTIDNTNQIKKLYRYYELKCFE